MIATKAKEILQLLPRYRWTTMAFTALTWLTLLWFIVGFRAIRGGVATQAVITYREKDTFFDSKLVSKGEMCRGKKSVIYNRHFLCVSAWQSEVHSAIVWRIVFLKGIRKILAVICFITNGDPHKFATQKIKQNTDFWMLFLLYSEWNVWKTGGKMN